MWHVSDRSSNGVCGGGEEGVREEVVARWMQKGGENIGYWLA